MYAKTGLKFKPIFLFFELNWNESFLDKQNACDYFNSKFIIHLPHNN